MSVRRDNSLLNLNQNSVLEPSASYTAKILPVGAVSSAASTYSSGTGLTTIPVFEGHGFTAGQKLMVGLTPTYFATVDSVTTTTVLFPGNTFTVAAAYTLIVNLGNDSGTTGPNYNGTTELSYLDPALTNQTVTPALVTADASGNYGYWHDGSQKWELVRNVAGTPQAIYTDIVPPQLTVAGTPVVGTEIVRFNGTDGLSIQGTPDANRPLVSDVGVITAPAANIFGTTGNTTSVLGALSVAQTAAVTGNLTVGSESAGNILPNTHNMSDLGTTGTRFKDLWLQGDATIADDVTVGDDLTVTDDATIGGDLTVNIIKASGNSVSATDFALTSGWSSSFTNAVTGTTTRFTYTITAAGTPTADPVWTLTFPNATSYASAPTALVILSGGTGVISAARSLTWSTTQTTLVVTVRGTAPAAGSTYIFTGFIIG